MTFDPVTPAFRAALIAPIAPAILTESFAFMGTLPDVTPGVNVAGDRDLTRIYGHWSCEPMVSVSPSYNAIVEKVKGAYVIRLSTDPRKNARRTFDGNGYAAHTYRRNTGAFGIALDGMDGPGVGPYDFGADGITTEGLLYLCGAVAAVACKYQIDISGLSLDSNPFYGETNFLTHAEAAGLPGFPPAYEPYFWADSPADGDTRGDLSLFAPLPKGDPVYYSYAQECGNAIRAMAHWIKLKLLKGNPTC